MCVYWSSWYAYSDTKNSIMNTETVGVKKRRRTASRKLGFCVVCISCGRPVSVDEATDVYSDAGCYKVHEECAGTAQDNLYGGAS